MRKLSNETWKVTFIAAAASLAAAAYADSSSDALFLGETAAAMQRMMAQMSLKSTGDVDRDFALMMIPHHRGAVEMAQAELRYGHNEQLRRLAQGIIVEQQQEIVVINQALAELSSDRR
jgi:uncharacterized protein (DUF305 family)